MGKLTPRHVDQSWENLEREFLEGVMGLRGLFLQGGRGVGQRALKARGLKLVRTVPTVAGTKEGHDAGTVLGSALRGLPPVLSQFLLLEAAEAQREQHSPTARKGRMTSGCRAGQDTSNSTRREPEQGQRQGRKGVGSLFQTGAFPRLGMWTQRALQMPVHPTSNAMFLAWDTRVPRGSLGAV